MLRLVLLYNLFIYTINSICWTIFRGGYASRAATVELCDTGIRYIRLCIQRQYNLQCIYIYLGIISIEVLRETMRVDHQTQGGGVHWKEKGAKYRSLWYACGNRSLCCMTLNHFCEDA